MKISSMLAVIGLLLAGPSVVAQGQQKKAKKDQIEQMKNELQLSDQQVSDIKMIQQAYNQSMKEIRQNDSLSPDIKKEQLNKLRIERKSEIEAKLTPDQRVKKEQLALEKMVNNRSEDQTEKLERELLLTPDQKVKVEALLRSTIKKNQEIKNAKMAMDDKRAKIKEVQAMRHSGMKEILNSEQLKKYEHYLAIERQKAIEKAKKKRGN